MQCVILAGLRHKQLQHAPHRSTMAMMSKFREYRCRRYRREGHGAKDRAATQRSDLVHRLHVTLARRCRLECSTCRAQRGLSKN